MRLRAPIVKFNLLWVQTSCDVLSHRAPPLTLRKQRFIRMGDNYTGTLKSCPVKIQCHRVTALPSACSLVGAAPSSEWQCVSVIVTMSTTQCPGSGSR